VFLGVLAAPALAQKSDANWRPALKTAYIFAYNDGSWFEGTGDPRAPTCVGHWTTYDDDGNLVAPADPIPANYDVVMQASWKFMPYGEVAKLPRAILIDLSIPKAGVHLSTKESRVFWTGPLLWDDYWVSQAGAVVPYDPSIRLKPYANRWLVPLTGKKGIAHNLTFRNKLPQGTYTVTYAETQVLPIIDFELLYDGQTKPEIFWPHARSVVPPYTFTVGPPAP
jgi:hypothetical protein